MPPYDPTKPKSVLRVALISRVLLLFLIATWRSIASPYDTSSSLNPSCLASPRPTTTRSILLKRVGSALEDSIVWDSVYFVRIAECGYEYEQTYAFLPLLPICIWALSRTVFAPLVPVIGYRAVLGLSGYVLNNVAFLFAAVYFYKCFMVSGLGVNTGVGTCWHVSVLNVDRCSGCFQELICMIVVIRLSVLILKDTNAAFRASVLFCFNPASIFYSSLYSESLYSLFSLGGLYHLLSGANTIAVLLLALSGSARSNGVLNAGYFCFQAMHQAYDAIFRKNRPSLAVKAIVVAAVRTLYIFAPFIGFQAYAYFNICHGSLSEELRPWCKARVPLLYDFLQSHYWGVGFLRYFQLKQLPNFLLASPILSLAVCSIIHYGKLRPDILFSLGVRASPEERNSGVVLYSLGTDQRLKGSRVSVKSSSSKSLRGDLTVRQRKQETEKEASDSNRDALQSDYEASSPAKQGYASILVLPFVLHMGFMTAVAFFVMHVQVATRFLSASPPLYWFTAYLMASPGNSKRWGYFIWAYFAAYILLGSLLFSNFYPFT